MSSSTTASKVRGRNYVLFFIELKTRRVHLAAYDFFTVDTVLLRH